MASNYCGAHMNRNKKKTVRDRKLEKGASHSHGQLKSLPGGRVNRTKVTRLLETSLKVLCFFDSTLRGHNTYWKSQRKVKLEKKAFQTNLIWRMKILQKKQPFCNPGSLSSLTAPQQLERFKMESAAILTGSCCLSELTFYWKVELYLRCLEESDKEWMLHCTPNAVSLNIKCFYSTNRWHVCRSSWWSSFGPIKQCCDFLLCATEFLQPLVNCVGCRVHSLQSSKWDTGPEGTSIFYTQSTAFCLKHKQLSQLLTITPTL